MTAVQWRAKRQPDGTVDTDMFDVAIVDSVNRFARSATPLFDDPTGDKKSSYPRGQRVELEYSTDDGATWTRRWAGFVQNRVDQATGGRFKAECVGYDFFLRRERVNKSYNDTISNIVQDLIQNFTAVDYNATKVTVTNDKTIDIRFEGKRVDQALDYLASASADESFGVDNDFDFFFEQQDQTSAPTGVVDGEWIDYDLPERGEKSLNRVTVYYGSGGSESFVTVEDREAQKDLKTKLGATSNAVISEEVTYPEIGNEDAAREKAQEILSGRSTVLSGEVTTFDRFEVDPNETFRLQISEKGIDTDFAVAQIEYRWQRDETKITITENKGNVAERLVDLAGDVRRVSMRDADTSATGTRFLNFQSGAEVSIAATFRTDRPAAGTFVAGAGQSNLGANRDVLGQRLAARDESTTIETKKLTKAALNMFRDVWQGEAATDLTHLAVGTDGNGATRSDETLGSEADRRTLERFGAGSSAQTIKLDSVRFPAGGALSGSDLAEAGVFDAASGGTLFARLTFDAVTHGSDTIHAVDLTLTVDDDPDEQGVITATGQERLRDLWIGETGHEPSAMVYGTGTTAPAESDTSLGNKVHEDTIDSTADRSTGITDVVERIGSGEANGNDLAELGEENGANELLSRIVFEALAKTNDFALETDHRFIASNA